MGSKGDTMDSFDQDVLRIKNKIQQLIYDPFVWKHIDEPVIDEDKIAIFAFILKQTEVDVSKQEEYIQSAMLMQIALDTHEKVSNQMEHEEPAILRTRQLEILAGDYFSSLYYHLVANTEDIMFIREFSQGVKDVNEAKVMLYLHTGDTVEECINQLLRIETSLVIKTAEFFNVNTHNDLIRYFLVLKRLLVEKERLVNNQSSKFIHALRSIVIPKNELALIDQNERILKVCNEQIAIFKGNIHALLIEQNSSSGIFRWIAEYLDNSSHWLMKSAEEG